MTANKVTNHMRRHMRENRQSMSLSELAAIHDVEPCTVRDHTKDIAPPPGGWKPSGRKPKFCRDKARRLEAQGVSRADIARRFGVTKPAVTIALGSKRN
ncbi:helix-turn-helix domain-containing protein [Microvirga lotononidis]|uniref:Resolvase HTH domain-containing protein n=1 Tax=Microvirga lotononidis TaxID=864069 RepID=I4YP01_9HYPH|nr:helix-turn-helix domain-containing protein [Microvirga lotononidis]EIM25693.1 hypothetical protein MicloDRAFT_00064200 [Microvirga lotononidis]WQO25630.1 hypothetical protein U0023_12975 [Microvirga lotononidis]